MRHIRRHVILRCCLMLLCLASALHGCTWTMRLDEQTWLEARGPNFTVKSRLEEKKTVALVEDLELFGRVVLWATSVERLDSPVPTRVYVFDGRYDFRQVEDDRMVAGRFLSGIRDNIVIMREVAGMDSASILKHEHVHLVMGSSTDNVIPVWYKEGLAEYLSTVHVKVGQVVVGWYPEDRIDNLAYSTWIPLGEILDPSGRERWSHESISMFYAQSWAFVHYLNHGREEGRDVRAEMVRYLQLTKSGADVETIVEEAFGQSLDSLDRNLRRHVYETKLRYGTVPVEKFAADIDIQTRVVPPSEIAADMGGLLLRKNRPTDAQSYFERAIAADPALGRAHAGLGDTLKFQGQWEAALPHYERAVAVSPDDAICELDFAEYWHERARETEDPVQRAGLLKLAREHYVKSWKLDDGLPETYAMYGETFLLEGERPEKALEVLEAAESLLPSDLSIRLMLATAYLAVGRPSEAIERARSVEAWSHPGSRTAQKARKLIEAGEAALGGLDSTPIERP